MTADQHNERVRLLALAIHRVQTSGLVHPMTCGNDSRHVLAVEINLGTTDDKHSIELICPVCGWAQTWFPLLNWQALAGRARQTAEGYFP